MAGPAGPAARHSGASSVHLPPLGAITVAAVALVAVRPRQVDQTGGWPTQALPSEGGGLAERPPVALPRPSGYASGAATRGVRRFTSGRGGYLLPGTSRVARTRARPKRIINKINAYTGVNLNFTLDEEKLFVGRVEEFVEQILHGTSFTSNSSSELRQAVELVEDFNPMLQIFVRSLGACALLSRQLSNKRSSPASLNAIPHALASSPGPPPSMTTGALPSPSNFSPLPSLFSPRPHLFPSSEQPVLPPPAASLLRHPAFPLATSREVLGEAGPARGAPSAPARRAVGASPAPQRFACSMTLSASTPVARVPSESASAAGTAALAEEDLFRSLS